MAEQLEYSGRGLLNNRGQQVNFKDLKLILVETFIDDFYIRGFEQTRSRLAMSRSENLGLDYFLITTEEFTIGVHRNVKGYATTINYYAKR